MKDTSPIIESTKHYYLYYLPTPQKYTKVATIGTVRKNHFSYEKALFQYFRKDLGILAETAYAEIQQPVESNPEEYEDEFNNPITAQAKFMVNKKSRFLFPTTLLYHQTPQKLPPIQLLTELSATPSEETAILQPIGKINKGKQPELASEEHLATTPDTATLEYYQSIYIYCKQKFNIPDGIEVVKKSVYQYIENCINNYLFGNYNISKVRSNLYNNLVHYSQLGTEDLNSETLATYFQELNFNIIEYCEKKYPVQSKYFFDFESETETSNKDKQRLKQYSRTTPNTLILQKTPAKHLQTPEQGTSVKLPLSITPFSISFENESNHLESLESEGTESEPEEITKNEEEMTTAYIAKIPEFTVGLKDKLIKKVCPHAPADLATAIRHAKSYEMAMEEANHIKLVNLAIGETSSAAEEKIDQLTKKVESYFTNQQQQQQQPQRYQPPQQCNQNNFGSPSNNQS
ncbi:hypothetical protein G9A89_022814 [Geosiphon pyriformis]|nr:hypothetical protein G9A89_022814 [Geosiphon pyriformis]